MNWLYEEYLYKEYDKEIADSIIEGYNIKRVSSFRVNTLKSNITEVIKILEENDIKYNKVSFYDNAFYFDSEDLPKLRNLDLYHNGKIYLQSLSSMIPPLFLEVKKGESILDMASAPGGKTSEIASLGNNEVLITAIEKNKIRCERLKYNLDKLGVKKVTTLNIDACNLDNYFRFDKILLDAPCSGSGTILLSEKQSISRDLIEKSVITQKKLLNKAIEVLKVGGYVIYSTCSILKEENEEVVKSVLQQGNVKLVPLYLEGVPTLPTTLEGVLCIKPTELYEGFFVAKIEKIK